MLEALSRTQRRVASEIENAYSSGMLPQSILFSGRKGSSRLTAALDLSFAIADPENRQMLRSSRVMLIASRSLRMETMAALSLFSRQRNDRSRIFLIQTVRKSLLQYHSSIAPLYENRKISFKAKDEEGRGGTLFSNAEAVDALIMELEDGNVSDRDTERIVSGLQARLIDDFFTLGKKSPGAAIDEIRAVQDWIEEGSDEKCVIIENPEDFTEGAKNSMLKMLEEPPEHCHLILISEHPSRILQTILSRVRRFQFPELTSKAVSSFIGDTFSIYDSYSSFDEFFFHEGTDKEERKVMSDAARLYSSALLEGRLLTLDEENMIFSGLEKMAGYDYFRLSVADEIEKALRGNTAPGRIRKAWNVLSEAAMRSDGYNMSIRLALDTALREAEIGK